MVEGVEAVYSVPPAEVLAETMQSTERKCTSFVTLLHFTSVKGFYLVFVAHMLS